MDHPLADRQLRRETLIDSVTVIGGSLRGTAKLETQALLMELFEVVDAQRRATEGIERIADTLSRLVTPRPVQPNLPFKADGYIVPLGET